MSEFPRRIRPLDTLLASQIAAGEVVERPASVLKELLENSLDAGAKTIRIELEHGGVSLLRVQDDGVGILREDLPLALAPQATSKIYSQDELIHVSTLGFRGEALASIASVSRLSLSSRAAQAEQAYCIEGENNKEAAPCAHPPGTSVEVRDLFYNVPVRRKFLRSERTEFEHALERVRHLALSRPDISITLLHNSRQVLAVRSGSGAVTQRLASVCGRAFVQQALKVDFSATDLHLHGWLLPAKDARPLANQQYFYLNGRAVRDRLVLHAVRQAYGDSIPVGRHPAYVLYLHMPPEQVDVNVHPAKQEVRFRDVRLLHDFLHRALHTALGEDDRAPFSSNRVAEAPESYQYLPQPAAPQSKAGRTLGAAAGRYLVFDEGEHGLWLIDLIAVRARQVARSLRTGLEDGQARSLPLLLPVPLRLDASETQTLLSRHALLCDLGFVLEDLGSQWVVRHIPAALRQVAPEDLIKAVLATAHEPEVLIGALASCAQALPERAEWEGLIAEAMQMPTGVARLLSAPDLAELLK